MEDDSTHQLYQFYSNFPFPFPFQRWFHRWLDLVETFMVIWWDIDWSHDYVMCLMNRTNIGWVVVGTDNCNILTIKVSDNLEGYTIFHMAKCYWLEVFKLKTTFTLKIHTFVHVFLIKKSLRENLCASKYQVIYTLISSDMCPHLACHTYNFSATVYSNLLQVPVMLDKLLGIWD